MTSGRWNKVSSRLQHLIDWSSNFDRHVDVIDEFGLRPRPVLNNEVHDPSLLYQSLQSFKGVRLVTSQKAVVTGMSIVETRIIQASEAIAW